jgi:multidrug efflux pump subunit AcrA (membrane-fusion protein)
MIAVLIVLLLTAPAMAAEPMAPAAHEHSDKQLYTCGMHPQVIRDEPGTCPICGMELTPLKATVPGAADSGVVVIDPAVVQNMGVRTAVVAEGPLRRRVRAVAVVREPQPAQHDVTLRVSGWIEKLYADVEGMHVEAGAPLFAVYSPELQVAIGELIAARRARPAGGDGHGSAALVYEAARQKLALLGLGGEQIEQLARLERPPATVTFPSPRSAHVTEKLVSEGDAVQAGQRILRLSDRATMWIDARVYEQDMGLVTVGSRAVATLPALPGTRIEGTISFIHPHLDPVTRTTVARMEVPNPTMALRQDMYATVEIEAAAAPTALLAPRDAVIDTGDAHLVFLARPAGHFEPRTVTVGASGDDGTVEIRRGLAAGDLVVTSGQFLIDAESNFRSAVQRFLSSEAPHVH